MFWARSELVDPVWQEDVTRDRIIFLITMLVFLKIAFTKLDNFSIFAEQERKSWATLTRDILVLRLRKDLTFYDLWLKDVLACVHCLRIPLTQLTIRSFTPRVDLSFLLSDCDCVVRPTNHFHNSIIRRKLSDHLRNVRKLIIFVLTFKSFLILTT